MKVNNINGTSDNSCQCGSWLAHWKKYSRQALPQYCPESTCLKAPTLGAHVQKDSATDRSWYIIPLCAEHNKSAVSLTVGDWITLVPANVSLTCRQK